MKQAYISTHLADAQSAGDRFHLNPIILLAQAALELSLIHISEPTRP